MFRSGSAIGIVMGLGLVPVHSNSANAEQQEYRHHFARPAVHHRDANHRKAAVKKEKDTKALLALKKEMRDLRRQVVAVEALRRELTDLKEKIWGPTPLSLALSVMPRAQSSAVVEPKQVTLKLPDLGEPYRPQAPVNPATAGLPAVIEERSAEKLNARSAVEEAKAYLIGTATPGYTMFRQGVPVAIGRLHPDFIIKLAAAIKLAREGGMTGAGVFSAYRPPAFGVGGFGDKFNSLHSYGLAADMTGIGRPGSRLARLWQTIVRRVGLHLPYGPNSHAEFNHTQLVPTKVASSFLRRTITAREPKDLRAMWLASGDSAYVGDVTATKSPSLASASAEGKSVLAAEGAPERAQAAGEQQPQRRIAPRASRARRSGKRAPPRGRAAGARSRSTRRKTGKTRRAVKAEK